MLDPFPAVASDKQELGIGILSLPLLLNSEQDLVHAKEAVLYSAASSKLFEHNECQAFKERKTQTLWQM